MTPARSYPVCMSRLRRGAGFLVLAIMLAGLAASSGSALAAGACCAMPQAHGSSDREAPCHSVAPTSCCEANAGAHVPGVPGAPIFAAAAAPPALAGHPLPGPRCGLPPALAARLATIVLRL
jgi:hypothetical protein